VTERANRAAHLATCPECTAKVEDYRQAARALDTWKLPAVRPHRPLFQPALQWAAAAALVLAAGIGIGRTTSPGPADPTALRQQMRAELAQMLRQELDRSASATLTASGNQTRELLGDYARYAEESRAQDARGFFNALTQLETRRVADHASLRKDLETVAVFSDAGLRQTQQGLIQLADYRPPVTPASNPTSSGNN
jgi:hypothetical protein